MTVKTKELESVQSATENHLPEFLLGEKFFWVSGAPLLVEGIPPTSEKASNDEKDSQRFDANGEAFFDLQGLDSD